MGEAGEERGAAERGGAGEQASAGERSGHMGYSFWLNAGGTREQGRAGVGRQAAVDARRAASAQAGRGSAILMRRAVGGARLVHQLAAERQAEAGLDAPAPAPGSPTG